ncbi:MAG: hypothetical protein WC058_15030, partial [Phycisphaeraceae bacterium]
MTFAFSFSRTSGVRTNAWRGHGQVHSREGRVVKIPDKRGGCKVIIREKLICENGEEVNGCFHVTVHGVKKPRFCFKNGGKMSQCSTIFRQTFVFGSKTAITR